VETNHKIDVVVSMPLVTYGSATGHREAEQEEGGKRESGQKERGRRERERDMPLTRMTERGNVTPSLASAGGSERERCDRDRDRGIYETAAQAREAQYPRRTKQDQFLRVSRRLWERATCQRQRRRQRDMTGGDRGTGT
jgi:hypothetical protein